MAAFSLPRNDNELIAWLANFQAGLARHARALELTGDEIDSVAHDYQVLASVVQHLDHVRAEARRYIHYRDLLRDGPVDVPPGPFPLPSAPPSAPARTVSPGVVPRIRRLVARLRAHPNYTLAVGEDLGTEPSASRPLLAPVPTGRATTSVVGSMARITFRRGLGGGVSLESRCGEEKEWTLLGIYPRSPIIDSRPPIIAGQAERREYRMRYVKGDEPTGDYSAVLAVTTRP